MPITLSNTSGKGSFRLVNNNNSGKLLLNAPPIVYSTNLTVGEGISGDPLGRYIGSVSIGGGPTYVILDGTFPVYDSSTNLLAHHFGGTSITVSEAGNATMTLSINGIPKEGSCANPITGTYTWNYTFIESDQIIILGSDCGG
jgi:hypothetical protein